MTKVFIEKNVSCPIHAEVILISCLTQTVLNRIPFNDFNEWINDHLPDVANFLDNRFRFSLRNLEHPSVSLND